MKKLSWIERKDRHGFVYHVMQTPLETLIVESWTESYCHKNGANFHGSPMPYDMENNTPLVWSATGVGGYFKDAEIAKGEAFNNYKEKVVQTLEGMSECA
jgi:hypothetical protein